MDKMLDVKDVMEILKVSKPTAYAVIREVNQNQKCKTLRGRVSEIALKKAYGLIS